MSSFVDGAYPASAAYRLLHAVGHEDEEDFRAALELPDADINHQYTVSVPSPTAPPVIPSCNAVLCSVSLSSLHLPSYRIEVEA
jgi:hypothetical protein